MFRPFVAAAIILSVMVLGPSVSSAEDFITKQQHRMRMPKAISPQSMPMFYRAQIFVLDDARAELKLAEEQGERIDKLLEDWCEHQDVVRLSLGERPREVDPTELEARRQQFEARQQNTEETLEGLREILKPEQYERLNQLVLQKLGVTALRVREPLIEKLNLEESQRREILKATRPGPRKAGEPSAHEQFLSLLTPEQHSSTPPRSDQLGSSSFIAAASWRNGTGNSPIATRGSLTNNSVGMPPATASRTSPPPRRVSSRSSLVSPKKRGS